MSPWHRRAILCTLLSGTLAAAYFAPALSESEAVPVSTRRGADLEDEPPRDARLVNDAVHSAGRGAKRVVQDTEVLAIVRRSVPEESEPVFQALNRPQNRRSASPLPVESQTVVSAPPAPPQAPPLPFAYLGRYVEDGQVKIFLQHKDQSLVVEVGDSIADTYKVEGLNDGVLTLLYLPLKQKQTLNIGALN